MWPRCGPRACGGHGRRGPTALQRGGDGHKFNRRVRPDHDDHLPRWQAAEGGTAARGHDCRWLTIVKELLMPKHLNQVRAEPESPVTLFDRDMVILVGLLATVEGELRAGDASPRLVRRLSNDATRYGLLGADAGQDDLAGVLFDMNQRLRVARGEYDGVP